MEGILQLGKYIGLGFLGIIWLYIAARMVARGIVRSIDERKNKEN